MHFYPPERHDVRNTPVSFTQRLCELRRRHFGPRGKRTFAEKLNIDVAEYQQYEVGRIPDPALLVRICELTGEDLQWLLTGVAARGTVVISGSRSRHQELIARIARALEERPERAGPIEAFLDLLLQGPKPGADAERLLAGPAPAGAAVRFPTQRLVPIFSPAGLPDQLPDADVALSDTMIGVALAGGCAALGAARPSRDRDSGAGDNDRDHEYGRSVVRGGVVRGAVD